jgi:lipopolysaccharide transport system permease protein
VSSQELTTSQESWDLVIRPQRAWWDLRLGELWKYRDLIRLMVWRDFVAAYKQTILGPLWHLIQPLMTTIVFTVIFGGIAKLPTDGLPPFLFYIFPPLSSAHPIHLRTTLVSLARCISHV